jgi:hypothetical protein
MLCAKRELRRTFGAGRAFIRAYPQDELGKQKKGDTNMKTLKTIVLAMSAVAMLGTTGLYAQTGIVANVPFNFTVDTVKMAAGEYTLATTSETSGVLQITNRETGASVLVNAQKMLSTHEGQGSGMIIFHRYGDRYFFSEVWTAYGLRGRTQPSKLEREIEAGNGEVALVSIPLVGARQ